MAKRLGILVSSNLHLDKLIKLVQTATIKGIKVKIFFTHLGTELTQDPRFKELGGLAEMYLCRVSFNQLKLKLPIPYLSEKSLATQVVNSEIIDDCDRYLVL